MYTYTEQSKPLNNRSEISKYMSELGKKAEKQDERKEIMYKKRA